MLLRSQARHKQFISRIRIQRFAVRIHRWLLEVDPASHAGFERNHVAKPIFCITSAASAERFPERQISTIFDSRHWPTAARFRRNPTRRIAPIYRAAH